MFLRLKNRIFRTAPAAAGEAVSPLMEVVPVESKAKIARSQEMEQAMRRAIGTAKSAPRIERRPADQGGRWVPTVIEHDYGRATKRALRSKRYQPNGARECARRKRT